MRSTIAYHNMYVNHCNTYSRPFYVKRRTDGRGVATEMYLHDVYGHRQASTSPIPILLWRRWSLLPRRKARARQNLCTPPATPIHPPDINKASIQLLSKRGSDRRSNLARKNWRSSRGMPTNLQPYLFLFELSPMLSRPFRYL